MIAASGVRGYESSWRLMLRIQALKPGILSTLPNLYQEVLVHEIYSGFDAQVMNFDSTKFCRAHQYDEVHLRLGFQKGPVFEFD